MRTLASYAAYYAKWSKVWEAQALLRADAVVGDEAVREGFTALIDPLRYPPEGITEADVAEIRRIKARVDRERLPRGADPNTHLKLGRGGLADIEWTVQLLQLRYAGRVPALRSPRTLTALDAARDADLIGGADHAALDRAWRSVSRLRNAITLVTGRSGDQIPRDARERAAVSSHPRATAPAAPTRWSTTTSAPPAGPAPSSTGCSGSDRVVSGRGSLKRLRGVSGG